MVKYNVVKNYKRQDQDREQIRFKHINNVKLLLCVIGHQISWNTSFRGIVLLNSLDNGVIYEELFKHTDDA